MCLDSWYMHSISMVVAVVAKLEAKLEYLLAAMENILIFLLWRIIKISSDRFKYA